MIRRKLNESENKELKRVVEHLSKTINRPDFEDYDKIYRYIFEDVNKVDQVFVHGSYVDAPGFQGLDLFEEVTFNNGEVHRFFSDVDGDKFIVEEVKFTPLMNRYLEEQKNLNEAWDE